MNQTNNEKEKMPLSFFQLRPAKAAKISEISEATAISPVPVDDRVNFHIGNPVQDEVLTNLYFELVTGLTFNDYNSKDNNFCDEEFQKNRIKEYDFIYKSIKGAAPYLPRGGFTTKKTSTLITLFHNWLTKDQQEQLDYDTGIISGKRECIISSGGIYECLRTFFHGINNNLLFLPANILLVGIELPEYLYHFKNLKITSLPEDKDVETLQELDKHFNYFPESPTFLIIGKILSEKNRRYLRETSLTHPLFFIEVNDAPNHLSLSREAKMSEKIIRILTPKIFSERFKELSLCFVAGNSDFIKIIESIHFQIKGTPSSTEAELLTYLIENKSFYDKENTNENRLNDEYNDFQSNDYTDPSFINNIVNASSRLSQLADNNAEFLNKKIERLSSITEKTLDTFKSFLPDQFSIGDKFSGKDNAEMINEFMNYFHEPDWQIDLSSSFLYSFIKHHLEYSYKDTFIVSGSARTALSLLGFHCGIKEVVTYDFSWTYEHCFQSVTVVPLTEQLTLDSDKIKKTIQEKIESNPDWHTYGAVVFNNPHNASGQVFAEKDIACLLQWLFEKNIFVIDDLSYQNVTPSQKLNRIKTLREITLDIIEKGYLQKEKEKYLTTVHSLSKTDSFAGARLAVIHIPHKELRTKFVKQNTNVKPNIFAIFIAYLFYRNDVDKVNAFWRKRNRIFDERMTAIEKALCNLPVERNPFNIEIKRPAGSMYPQMIIHKLPKGLSLEWLASGLASQGIGLIPLSTFARTEDGFELARKTFRLTLGGTDGAEVLSRKTRRVLIDLNKLISEEAAKYNRNSFSVITPLRNNNIDFTLLEHAWNESSAKILDLSSQQIKHRIKKFSPQLDAEQSALKFIKEYLPERLKIFQQKFIDRKDIVKNILSLNKGNYLIEKIEKELYKEDISERERKFKLRLFDRTVHPTQMFSLKTDILFDELIDAIIKKGIIPANCINKISGTLIDEYLGLNVSINSADEAFELLYDLKSLILAEEFINYNSNESLTPLLSFWGDWDGSTRPSGQGHRLVASALIENVNQLCNLINLLRKHNTSVIIDSSFLEEIENLPARNRKFWILLNEITQLTNQLEKRYKSILPYSFQSNRLMQFGRKLHVVRDPFISLWQHNDRLEKRMIAMRQSRRQTLEYYFSLNKRLRKEIYRLLPDFKNSLSYNEIALETGLYKNLLNRFILTPRINQKMITARDQFPIDTTVHNIVEINEISGKYGNPGMVLGLQVSMSTDPEALISLDRKINSRKELSLRENTELQLPAIWIIPLFEDIKSVNKIETYMDNVWEYSVKTRHLNQSPQDRFSEMMCELFIAGSDLSQQVSQPAAAELYKEAKHKIILWLAKKGLVEKIRMKLGSGEPMQRQGGYYAKHSGKPAFIISDNTKNTLKKFLKDSTRKSTEYAASPLWGIFSEGDLRTFQSNISEKLRYLSSQERAGIIFHLQKLQHYYREELKKAAEPVLETRLPFSTRGFQQLERLTIGKNDPLYRKFTEKVTENFQQILYGKDNDVVGIHAISYFISRAIPNLRDRPAVRPGKNFSENKGQKILEQIAEIIPLSKRGSLLRAIGHNQAQTVILGINQLTTGLFRSLNEFSTSHFPEADAHTVIIDRVLPRLPVYEILQTLRIYHDNEMSFLNEMEKLFPAGNSAFLILREDIDSMFNFIGLFQKELLRRHGINVQEFFNGNKFKSDLLVTLRPDLAVLLQPDLFNTEFDGFISGINISFESKWKDEVKELLHVPVKIKEWRSKIWEIIKKPIAQQVESFVELAIALNNLSGIAALKDNPFSLNTQVKIKLGSGFENLLRDATDDSMKNFLVAAVQYLTRLTENNVEVPVDIIRALKDVERILRIEEQVLTNKEQDLLRYYLLQIARLTGENG